MLALSEMIRLLYYVGKPGWTQSDLEYFRRLMRYYQINRDEDPEVGMDSQTVNCHMLHTLVDIQVRRWGATSNSSCWGYEQAVGDQKEVPHNGKDFQQPMAKQSAVIECLQMLADTFPRRNELTGLFIKKVHLRC